MKPILSHNEITQKQSKVTTKIDFDILNQLMNSFRDIKEGRVRRVK